MRVRIARDELRGLRELTETIDALEAEIGELVAQVAPQLLAEAGVGPLTAGKLIGEIAGARRFSSEAKLARAAGLAPIRVSSGKTTDLVSVHARRCSTSTSSRPRSSPRNRKQHSVMALPIKRSRGALGAPARW